MSEERDPVEHWDWAARIGLALSRPEIRHALARPEWYAPEIVTILGISRAAVNRAFKEGRIANARGTPWGAVTLWSASPRDVLAWAIGRPAHVRYVDAELARHYTLHQERVWRAVREAVAAEMANQERLRQALDAAERFGTKGETTPKDEDETKPQDEGEAKEERG